MVTSDRQSRTWMCTVVFLDIAGFTQQSVTRQVNVKSRLEQLIACAVADIPEEDRLIVDTGDGAALCHFGDPEEALFIAVRLRESLRGGAGGAAEEPAARVRIGINLGPIRMTKTITGQPNPLGDGINNAQRVMAFADPDQILVSRSFYDMIACLSQGYSPLFTPLGSRKDKHGKEHEVYELLVAHDVGAATARVTQAIAAQPEPAPTVAKPAAPVVPAAEIQLLTEELANHIGPLAAVLVRKAVERAPDVAALYQTLAEALPSGGVRQRFLALRGIAEQANIPAPSAATPTATAPKAGSWNEDELKQAEHRLAAYLGPVARVLVRRTAGETTDRERFYQRLADELASAKDRESFLNQVARR